jgi:hypothetical protein
MAVKATDVILAMLAYLPFLVGSLVAVPTYFRGDGQGHYSVFFRMSLAHNAMAGFTGDTGM